MRFITKVGKLKVYSCIIEGPGKIVVVPILAEDGDEAWGLASLYCREEHPLSGTRVSSVSLSIIVRS